MAGYLQIPGAQRYLYLGCSEDLAGPSQTLPAGVWLFP